MTKDSECVADSTVRELIDEIKANRDSTEELYILLDHIWRNRDEFREMLAQLLEKRAEESTEVVCCARCDASCSSLAEAVQDQWISLQHDPCDSYDYLGICADCQQEEAKREAASKMEGNGGQQPVNGELLETLRFLVQEVQQPELADSYVGDAVKKARVVLGKYAAGGKTDVETTGHEMGLTDEQVEHAKEDGVTTAVGLRRIEKNTRADEVPETIACARCDVESPESLAAALQEGWTELCRDDGAGWNYLGVCPECQAQEDQVPEGDATEAQEQKRLFG